VWGRDGEEGTTAGEFGEGGVVESKESVGGEEDGDPLNELSGTKGDEGSDKQDEEDNDVHPSRSMSRCGDMGGC